MFRVAPVPRSVDLGFLILRHLRRRSPHHMILYPQVSRPEFLAPLRYASVPKGRALILRHLRSRNSRLEQRKRLLSKSQLSNKRRKRLLSKSQLSNKRRKRLLSWSQPPHLRTAISNREVCHQQIGRHRLLARIATETATRVSLRWTFFKNRALKWKNAHPNRFVHLLCLFVHLPIYIMS